MNELYHYGIEGMKWGVRRYQNPDGTLTEAGKRRLARKDNRWVNRNDSRLQTKALRKSSRELKKYDRQLLKDDSSYLSTGKLSSTYVNNYNRKMAELMNKNIGDIESPSGRVVRFVAKRGEVGVFTALADKNYDMSQLKNGIWNDARVSYKKDKVGVMHSEIQNGNCLMHHGRQGMKWGVRNGPPYPLKVSQDDYNTKTINKNHPSVHIIQEDTHKDTPREGIPNSIVDKKDYSGKVVSRTFYDKDGIKDHDIHTTDHHRPDIHDYGDHGEHVTRYFWKENGDLDHKENRELTNEEKEDNKDIL